VDCTFFGLTAVCLLVLRRRHIGDENVWFKVPGHPWTTLVFIAAEWIVVASTAVYDPRHTGIGFGIALAGIPAYLLWRSKRAAPL